MNEFLQQFESKIKAFWDVEEDEKQVILKEILLYANQQPTKFMDEFHPIKFDMDLMPLAVIFEALSTDTENWGHFYVEIVNDILESSKKSDKSNLMLFHLHDLSYIQDDEKPFVQDIVDLLSKEIDSNQLHIQLACIWTLPMFLRNTSVINRGSIIERLRRKLIYNNWKVRVMAFKALNIEELLPEGHKLSTKDKLLKMILGEPNYI